MKTRPAALRGTALSPTDTPPNRNPDSVGQVVSMGDATSAPVRASQQQATPANAYKAAQKAEAPPPPYTGDERRKNDRRKSAITTTLDTRKSGPDRRKNGRISVKV
jgi:hypothetical protein